MVGLFSYLATIEFIPQWMYLVAFALIVVRRSNSIAEYTVKMFKGEFNISLNGLIVVLIFGFSLLNFFFNRPNPFHTPGNFPYHVLIIPTVVVAGNLKQRDIQVILICLVIESLIAVLEFFLGISTILVWSDNFTQYSGSNLLYFSRPYGLSSNSSILAFKVLMGILLLRYHKFKGVNYRFMELLFLVVVFLTFGRTVILAVLFFYAAYQMYLFGKDVKKKPGSWLVFAFGGLSALLSLIVLATVYSQAIINQFTRNTGSVELSGREVIWEFYGRYIEQFPLLGNASLKLMFGDYHAHNSFLQLVSSNGYIIAALFVLLILKNLKFKNLAYVATILVYSMAQYGVFWGISLVDILFYYFLLEGSKSLSLADAMSNFKREHIEHA